MSDNKPPRLTLPLARTFGAEESALDEEGSHNHSGGASQIRGRARISFSTANRRASLLSRWRKSTDEEADATQSPTPQPAIPSALQPADEVYATPLPMLSMAVLSITMLGEFLSANVSAPFILFMVQGFNQFPDEARAGYWTGLLVSTFFLTQFLTSLLWATVAAKHGQRIVLFISLLGSAITCCMFGTSTSIQQAMAIRLMQGIFAGAVGVARGCVVQVTDPSNEGRAYAILGFCWGFGGVAGAIVGGSFESPAVKWPSLFEDISIFVDHPYLLPCAVASSITFIGSILCLFLGPDAGPREGAIRLVEKTNAQSEDESTPNTPLFEEPEQPSVYGSIRQKVSGYFGKRVYDSDNVPTSPPQPPEESVPLATTPSRVGKGRISSRTSRADGSAYGYSGAYRNRLGSAFSGRSSMAMSFRHRRESNLDGVSSSVATGSDMNFAQRLLMANENAVTNIADLWVAAAMNVDNEDVFETDSEFDDDDDGTERAGDDNDEIDESDVFGTRTHSRQHRPSRRDSRPISVRSHSRRPTSRRPAPLGSPRIPSSSNRHSAMRTHSASHLGVPSGDELSPRRLSIFSHVGVRTPPAVLEAQQMHSHAQEPADSLEPIMESRRAGQDQAMGTEDFEKEPSLMSQLPVLIIIQYGLLALHSTTHDQVFYLYLVSKYPLGGLNLNAGHFSQLIALMCLAQIAYQFYLYPNIGPPRGRFSHLSMFRIGSLLFIPSYLSVILYRVLASPETDGNPILMAALALSTAVRFCGSTFGYTAISVLLNYTSPPHLVGFANGIAQSIVSLARFFGPILGGTLWSMSVEHDPSGYPLGFIACACACALAVAHSFFIR